MNYSKTIKDSVDYIETHIKESLTAQQIARDAGYSLSHFCRLFAKERGISVMDYVRGRRLSLARMELLAGRKILDTALDYGFETASGFTKAFRKEFGYAPTLYLARMAQWKKIPTETGGVWMKPKFKKIPEFFVAGYGIQTQLENGYMRDIAAYWENYDGENLESKMYEQLTPPKHGEYGLCVRSDNGKISYLLGVAVEDFSKATPDMIRVKIPAAEYAVFTTDPVDLTDTDTYDAKFSPVIKGLWKYIFEQWFPSSGYEYDEGKLDFEFYDERCHFRPDSTMDIYIPVKKKKS